MPKHAVPPWGSVRTELRRFRRDLPALAAIHVIVAVAVLVWRLVEGDSFEDAALLSGITFATIVVLSPLLWIRRWRETPERDDLRRALPVFALAVAWWALWMAALIALLAISGALGP